VARERVVIAPTAPSEEARRSVLERARRRGFSQFAVPAGDSVAALPGEVFVEWGPHGFVGPGGEPRAMIPLYRVQTPDELDHALRGGRSGSTLALEWTGDRMIPLENAIAQAAGDYEIWTVVRELRSVPGALGALEHGAHRVIVCVTSPSSVDELESLLEASVAIGLDWTVVPVRSVRPGGVGDRVIVDTTSLLAAPEGMLVGSTAAFLFHVASEAVGSRFSRPRPFRVNAGAAHSYILLADGGTKYLSELDPGDSVLAAVPGGRVRPVRVGRVKIERRPLVVVTARVGEDDRTIFLQEAETVRLSGENERIATTEIAAGVRVHGVSLSPARHLGRVVEETIIER